MRTQAHPSGAAARASLLIALAFAFMPLACTSATTEPSAIEADAISTEGAVEDGAVAIDGNDPLPVRDALATEVAVDAPPDARADSTPVDAGPFVPPSGSACEYAFFSKYFDKDNGPTYAALRDTSFLHIHDKVKELQGCGAKITLGGMLSLMIYEGGGAKVAFFNDRCSENSYDKSASCWSNPKARYSYQYGLAPVHTSNFHPCADVAYTSKMRARLAKAMGDAGFAPTAAQIGSVSTDLKTFCPAATPSVVDYYILTAHTAFDVPKSTVGNNLENAGKYPFFTPRVVIDLFFATVSGGGASCAALTTDNAAIVIFGGGDASYKTPSKQETILKLWRDFKASSCP